LYIINSCEIDRKIALSESWTFSFIISTTIVRLLLIFVASSSSFFACIFFSLLKK